MPHWRRVSSCGKWHFYNSSALSIATYTKPEMRKIFQDADLDEIICGRRQEQLCSCVFLEILKLFIILQGWLEWCLKTWPLLVKVSTMLFLRFLLSFSFDWWDISKFKTAMRRIFDSFPVVWKCDQHSLSCLIHYAPVTYKIANLVPRVSHLPAPLSFPVWRKDKRP